MVEDEQVEVKEGDVLAGKYLVEQVLGVGGMGIVVAARHTVLNHRVALKFLRPSLVKKTQTAARFLREAQAAVKIKSPHVARVLDVGELADSGAPYMVMEYLEGLDISQLLEREGTLEVEQCADFALQTCEALAAAHAAGIIHRDVKPANLFLTRGADGSAVVKVLDFGISKNMDDAGQRGLTQTQVSMGSPLYMAPEQMRSAKDVDVRADVWSMGVVLFEMLTGQMPFMAETMPQLCALVLEAEAPRVTRLRPDVSEALADVVAGCLKKDRSERFESIAALADALAPFAPDGVVSAQRTRNIIAGAGLATTADELPAVRRSGLHAEPANAVSAPSADAAVARSAKVSESATEIDVVIGEPAVPSLSAQQLRGTSTAFGSTRSGSAAAFAPRRRVPWWAVGGAGALVALIVGVLIASSGEPTPEANREVPPGVAKESTQAAAGLGSVTPASDPVALAPSALEASPPARAQAAAQPSAAPKVADAGAADEAPEPGSSTAAARGAQPVHAPRTGPRPAGAPAKPQDVSKRPPAKKDPSAVFGERF